MRGKKGDTIVLETSIFIVLNTIFFIIMLVFVAKAGAGAFVYEQSYAKQVKAVIDNSDAGMVIDLNIKKAIDMAVKNGVNERQIVRIDEKEKKIIVNLVGKSGYSIQYFSNNKVSAHVVGDVVRIEVTRP